MKCTHTYEALCYFDFLLTHCLVNVRHVRRWNESRSYEGLRKCNASLVFHLNSFVENLVGYFIFLLFASFATETPCKERTGTQGIDPHEHNLNVKYFLKERPAEMLLSLSNDRKTNTFFAFTIQSMEILI